MGGQRLAPFLKVSFGPPSALFMGVQMFESTF